MAQGAFLSDLKKGQKFTLPNSKFPDVIYTKGIRLPHSNYFNISWTWEGEEKKSILQGYRYCLPVNS